jgi:hypothetical protein
MQKVDLYQPLISSRVGPPPIVLNVGVQRNSHETAGGLMETALTPEHYVLLSALPAELRDRVKSAVQAILSGM